MRRLIWLSVVAAIAIAYPLLLSSPFQQRLGALVLLYAIAASAWNIVGGYAGQVSVGHVVFFGCGAYAAMGSYANFGLSPLVGIPAGIVLRGGDRRGHRRADAAAVRPLFQHGDDRGRRDGAADRHQHRLARRGRRALRSDRAAQRLRSLVPVVAAVLLSVPARPRDHAADHLVDDQQPDGILPARDQGFRARRALARRARQPHQALRLHAERGADRASPARSMR